MSDEPIADVPNEGEVIEDTAFDQAQDNVEKTTPESQPETKQAEQPSQGGDNSPGEKLPFHQHPRWKKLNETNKELQTRLADFEKRFQEVEPLIKARQATEQPLPDWWKQNYGDSPESKDAHRKYEETTKAERDRIKTEVLDQIQKDNYQSMQADQSAQQYIEGELEAMKEEGLPFETNELMKFIIDFQQQYGVGSLLDTQGNYDLRKAHTLMQNFQPRPQASSTETKKKLAGETVRTKVVAPKQGSMPVISSRALRRGNWRDAQ